MKCCHDRQRKCVCHQPVQARTHLLGGSLGKRHRQDSVRIDALIGDQVGNPVRQGKGFSGSRTGYNQQWIACVRHRPALVAVERIEQRFGGLRGRSHSSCR